MSWTADRVAALVKLRHEGRSTAGIAAELGEGVTRNAVIGKLHRLGVSRPAAPAVAKPSKPATARPAGPLAPPPPPSPPERFASLGDALLALPSRPACRWPMDIDAPEDVRFCAEPATCGAHRASPTLVYCPAHYRRSIGPGTPSERRALRAFPVHA